MPGNYNLDRPWVRGKEIEYIEGSFAPNGSSNPISSGFKGGHIKSIVHTATGQWTVTLRDKGIRDIESWSIDYMANSNANNNLYVFNGFTNVGAGQTGDTSFIIRNSPGGTDADITADPVNRISFRLRARRSVNK